MARPVTIDSEDILTAAREVFLEKGVNATTADIAKRAGVSEGTLFHRYKTKEALFRSAMIEIDPRVVVDSLDLEGRVGRGVLFDELVDLGTRLVDLYRIIVPGVMMLQARGGADEESDIPRFLRSKSSPPMVAVRSLAAYFEGEMRAKRIRPMDGEILARMFIGSLWQYVFFEMLGGQVGNVPLPQAMYVRGFVDALLHGIGLSGRKT
jgi:AcrR family transcriptional regulator